MKAIRNANQIMIAGAVMAASLMTFSGCTSRAITITSLPPGAEVSINRRVVGKTPIRVGYTHGGAFRVEVRKDRYDPKIKVEKIRPAIYGYDPISFVADNMVPMRINDETSIHYVLKPVKDTDRGALLSRATLARSGEIQHPFTKKKYTIAMRSIKEIKKLERMEKVGENAGPAARPDLKLPKESAIKEKRPEAPDLAKELGIDSKDGKATKDKDAKKKPKRMRRTPKGEILIYDDEPIEDPDKKKK